MFGILIHSAPSQLLKKNNSLCKLKWKLVINRIIFLVKLLIKTNNSDEQFEKLRFYKIIIK